MSTYNLPVVVGVDGSASARQALDWAVDQAVAEHRGFTVVHALGRPTPDWTDIGLADPQGVFAALEREGQAVLDAATAQIAERAPELSITQVLEFQDARELLVRESAGAALLVVGSRGRGPIRSLLLGSISVAVAKHAVCPVVVHRPSHRGRVTNGILVAVDAGPGSREVLELAFHLASVRGLPLTVLHSQWDVDSLGNAHADLATSSLEVERLELAEAMAGLGEKYPDVRVTTTVATGPPEGRIHEVVDQMDLLVVGAHRRTGTARILHGSVALSLVEHAAVPVVVVPNAG